ncbi:Mov34/MPN/PAD-1 family protein [Enterobacter sp.]|uniref:Mov34/MPN/PAD-1 family protein n=1 Tax=Enterobacter sp. TaxID=42895 RepID=UPI00296F2C74|nr:Mov34/MPN/PAD-1 family protein [Enterobacter sp.]
MSILSKCRMAPSSGNPMNIKDVTFSCVSAEYTVNISSSSLQQVIEECIKAGMNETGGILIGSYSEDGSTAFIVEATARPADSIARRTTFQRGVKGLKHLLGSRWETGKYYVGEWHFHPAGSSDPSNDDFISMKNISSNPNYQCPEPVMIILGGNPLGAYSLSASVFPRGKSPIRLAQE